MSRRNQEPPASGSAATDSEPDPDQVARTIVLRKLTAGPRSRQQLAEALETRDVPDDVVNRVLDRFAEVGLINDGEYAEMLVRTRHSERHLGRRALRHELRRKGIGPEEADRALEAVDDTAEEAAARAVAEAKARSTQGLDRHVRVRRMAGALGRKGFGGDLSRRLINEVLEGEEESADL